MRKANLCLVGLLWWAATAAADTPATTNAVLGSFIRYQAEGQTEGHVDTAVKTYTRADGVAVTLFAALHVADRAYYEKWRNSSRSATPCSMKWSATPRWT